MAYTFDELIAMQRAAEQAHNRVQELRVQYGPPTHTKWTPTQARTYETAMRAWRDLARDVQAAVAEYAKAQGEQRSEVEAAVKRGTQHPEA
ncbi:hypothetical protein [Streptomyces sp. TRM68367]|uniref:hypothetical protein n=1 Tax=Streptomyces sp. TRM68367 TaxID=2758415 RepID=UPI00165B1482|nr:hypothetical protein [Streptomyces sp. TRM68367]MBC9728305.1 hypothetical protein [Streptomyces sp. TRM68367]